MQLVPGTVIAKGIRLDQKLGEGGHGDVWAAWHERLEREVAVKLLRPGGDGTPQHEARFEQEARLVAELSSPHIVQIFEAGRTSQGLRYWVMERLSGEDLDARLKRRPPPLSVGQTVAIVSQICRALGAAHDLGIVHRDVKPANIFLVEEPSGGIHVKLLDFGVAKRFQGRREELTQTGMLIGTPYYMSPEQMIDSRTVDHHADLWATAVLSYLCLTGGHPFPSDNLAALSLAIHEGVFTPPSKVRTDLPAAVDGWMARALAREPAARFGSASVLAATLERALFDEEVRTQASLLTSPASIRQPELRMTGFLVLPPPFPSEPADRTFVVIGSHHGELDVLADGTRMVAFRGTATADEAASRAAECALALRKAVGIATSAVVMGRAAGDLQSERVAERGLSLLAARADGIRLDDTAAALLRERFAVERDEESWVVHEARPLYAPRGGLMGCPTPFVGREEEMELLSAALTECVERSIARVVLVTGAAGVGKSRLQQSFLRNAPVRARWYGRNLPGSVDAPYRLVQSLLGDAFAVHEALSAEQVRQHIQRWAGEEIVDETTLDVLTQLAASSALPTAAGRRVSFSREVASAAWQWVVGKQCDRGPVVWVIEDLHWADKVSLDLIELALRRQASRALFVLASARPEIHERDPDLWRRCGRTELALGAISPASGARLVGSMLGGAGSEDVVARIVEQGEGNPFLLEELIRASMKSKTTAPPESVLAVVEARITQRPPEERRLLRAAAVLGSAFDVEGIAGLLHVDRGAVHEQLDALTDAELLVVEGEGEGGARYQFRHGLIRDAAYEMLSSVERQTFHRRAVEWLKRRSVDPSEMASHLQRAGDTEAAAAEHARASALLAWAGDRESAERHVDQALALGAYGGDITLSLSAAEKSVRSVVLIDARHLDSFGTKQLRLLVPEVTAVVRAFGGLLGVLEDGSLVATFSDATTPTDLVQRAARAGLALRRFFATARFGQRDPALGGLVMSLALGTSESVVEGNLLDLLERARRLSRRLDKTDAHPGVAIDEIAAPLLDARFILEERDVAILLGERDAAPAARTLLGRATRCVGRDRELRELRDAFTACVDRRRASAHLVTAGPGVGKSRLRYELLRSLWDSGHSAHVLMARGDPVRAGAPFGVMSPALRRSFGIREDEPALVQRQRIALRVGQRVQPEHAERLTTWLGELCGVPVDPWDAPVTEEARRDPGVWSSQLASAFEDLMMAEARERPVLIVVEDLQWSDAASVQLIVRALQSLAEQPLFVLALARPEVLTNQPELAVFQHHPLSELDGPSAEALAYDVLGAGVEAHVVEGIVSQAGGNPFLLEELLRASAEGHADLPRTALALSQMRIEALPPARRRVLRAASIFGHRFWAAGLESLLGDSRPLAEDLGALVDGEFIARTSSSRFGEQGEEFVFRHLLVRDAAYGLLTEADRKKGHRRAAEWIESVAKDDSLAIAEHLERAGEPTHAIGAYRRAVEKALEGNDLEAALVRADRAIACGATGADLIELHHLRMRAHNWRGAREEEFESAREVLALAPFASAAWCDAALVRASRDSLLGERQGTAELAATLAGLLASRARTPVLALTAARLVEILFALGDNEAAVSLRVAVLPAIAELGGQHRRLFAHGQIIEGWYGYYYGRLDDAVHVHQRAAIAAFLDLGNVRRASLECANQASGHKELGELETAEAAARQGLTLASRHGIHRSRVIGLLYLGIIRARRGAISEGMGLLTEASALAIATGEAHAVGPAHFYRAEALAMAGDWENAMSEARTVLSVTGVGEGAIRVGAQALIGQALLRRGEIAEGLREARAAMAIVEATDHLEENVTRGYLALAEALEANGDLGAARGVIHRAMTVIDQRAVRIRRDFVREQFFQFGACNAQARSMATRLSV